MTNAEVLPIKEPHEFGCDIQSSPSSPITIITCREQSSPFVVAKVDIPENAEYLSFNYRFPTIGDGDYAAVLLDDIVIWLLAGSNAVEENVFADSGPIPIGGFRGEHKLTVALYGIGQPDAEFEIKDFRIFGVSNVTQVSIDIKPGSFPNSINPKSKGVIPVAILTTDTFDATTVDPLSVKFGPNGATEAHGRGHTEDVNGDGKLDMVLHFNTQKTGIQCGDTSASLTGKTVEDQDIEGSDSIQTVGCK